MAIRECLRMKITCIAFGLFACSFLLHWIIWRIKIPRRQTASLLAIFMGSLLVGLAALGVVPALQRFTPVGFWQYAHVAIFQIAMSLAYIVAYSAIEERSPTMALMSFVAAAGERGRTQEELFALLKGFLPIEARLNALLRDGMFVEVDGRYRLTAKGKAWDYSFNVWRHLTRLRKGG
jgi:hypothetical protein